jgi:hypothetical protein
MLDANHGEALNLGVAVKRRAARTCQDLHVGVGFATRCGTDCKRAVYSMSYSAILSVWITQGCN